MDHYDTQTADKKILLGISGLVFSLSLFGGLKSQHECIYISREISGNAVGVGF